jgi:C1A family cysteine protease
MGIMQSISAVKAYGWKPDLPDIRDKKLKFSKVYKHKSKVDLRNFFDPVYDQKNIGSCTASAVCAAFRFDQTVKNIPNSNLSILFLYYNSRELNGISKLDSGASIRDTIKSANKFGICDEVLWGYNPGYFNVKPYTNCYTSVKLKGKVIYRRLTNDLNQLKTCLSANKPFIFGFSVYDSFEDPTIWNPKIDAMPYPNPNKEKLIGGHTVVAVGYSDKRKCFIVRNNWGPEWGLEGYFFMSYEFICSEMTADFWIAETNIGPSHIIDDINLPSKQESSKQESSKQESSKQESSKQEYLENTETKTISTEIVISPTKPTGKCLIR